MDRLTQTQNKISKSWETLSYYRKDPVFNQNCKQAFMDKTGIQPDELGMVPDQMILLSALAG